MHPAEFKTLRDSLGLTISTLVKVIDVDELTVSNSWLHTADGTDEFDIADYLNFKDGFDLAILDDNDNFIDYIQIHDYENGQYTNFNNTCGYGELSYVKDISSSDITNGTVILFRTPDGTGSWIEDKNTTKYPTTLGRSNSASLALHLEFSEGSGQTTADSSGNSRTATLGSDNSEQDNDPLWQCNTTTGHLSFDGSEQDRLTTPSFTPPTEGAVAFWMKSPAKPTSNQRIFGFGDNWEARFASIPHIHIPSHPAYCHFA